ncbi:MAG: protein translocase subunit SecF, partial [Ignavibacteriales bacterium]|nr:protein translocase subunit SecF [Ignavibacteriales bacterium]
GLDFTGGTELVVGFNKVPDVAEVRAMMNAAGFAKTEIKTFGDPNKLLIRTQTLAEGTVVGDRIKAALKQTFPSLNPQVLEEQKIGAKVGAELRKDAFLAVVFSLIAMLIYVGFRFKFIYGVGAVAALFHDVLVTLGVISLVDGLTPFTNFEIDQNMIAAFLTLVGLSVNDTVVIFDRMRENQKIYRSMSLSDLMNKSLNETLSRTIITSGTIFIVTVVLFLLGGEVNRGFAFAMTIGIITGTYSSIYIASAIVLDYTNRKLAKKQKPAVTEKATYEVIH